MCKESWCVRLWKKRVSRGWGDCLKYLKTGWNRKQARRNRDFKKEGAKWVKGLKIGEGAGILLRTKADLPRLVYEEICSKFYFKIHSSF